METQQIRLEVDEYINPITKELGYDDRLFIGSTALHCGDTIEVLLPKGWIKTTIEKGSNGWYFTNIGASLNPVGLIARTIE